jgi:4'-phosphopantetheinyl transferase
MRLYISAIEPFMNLQNIELVTASRQKQIQRYIRREDKARSLVAGLLLRDICGVTHDEQIFFGENGKPYLKNKNMYFNISHSGDYVVLAVADSEIGVDIEKITTYDNAVAARCFTQAEQEWLKKQRNNESFFTLWTAKESIMKASGLGFSLPPETFCVLPVDSSAHLINGKLYFLNWLTYDGHIICVAMSNDR